MQKKGTKLYWEKEHDRALLVNDLRKDEVVISSTDTVYGLLGNITAQSYDRICELKKIETKRPFLLLIGEFKKLFEFIDRENVSNRITQMLSVCWPGPVTVIFRAKAGLPSFLVGERGTIAVRCPKHEGLLSVLREFDALFSTSANQTGDSPPVVYADISLELLTRVPYVVMDDTEVGETRPSTIIDVSDSNKNGFTVIREGVYSVEALQKIYDGIKL